MFGIGSARLLAGAIGAIHPRRYVEIGSGFSSAVLLDINEEWRGLLEVLPLLPVGTFVHFHDIFYPFDYPAAWLIDQNRSWNEAYFLRAFLMYNAQFKVHFWSDYLGLFAGDRARGDRAPSLLPTRSSSIWLERVAP
jgi:hypothetical protein